VPSRDGLKQSVVTRSSASTGVAKDKVAAGWVSAFKAEDTRESA
jgi:hypothetical protein